MFFSFFGLLAIPLLLLVASNIVDWITGIMACKNRGEKLTSERSMKGITKKIAMYLLVFVGFLIDVLIQYAINTLGLPLVFPNIIASIVAVWITINEILSIIENIDDIGLKIPPFLKPILQRMQRETEDKISIEDSKEEKKENKE